MIRSMENYIKVKKYFKIPEASVLPWWFLFIRFFFSPIGTARIVFHRLIDYHSEDDFNNIKSYKQIKDKHK